MKQYTIRSKQPNCKVCEKPMKHWNPFEHNSEHVECSSKRIVKSLMGEVKKDLKKINYELLDKNRIREHA